VTSRNCMGTFKTYNFYVPPPPCKMQRLTLFPLFSL
jgi:hypothetical protein